MKLTPEQLSNAQAALAAENEGKPWQIQRLRQGDWEDATSGHCAAYVIYAGHNVRPKPAPKTRPWNGPGDVPLNC